MKTLPHKLHLPTSLLRYIPLTALVLFVVIIGWGSWHTYNQHQTFKQQLHIKQTQLDQINIEYLSVEQLNQQLSTQLASVSAQYQQLATVDQKLRNDQLEATISAIEDTYQQAVETYEQLIILREQIDDTQPYDEQFTKSLVLLSQQNFASASSQLAMLNKDIASKQQALIQAAQPTIPPAPASNTPPNSGYSRQQVSTQVGTFLVSIVAGNLGSTRVIVDTASSGDCHNDCPVLSLADYVSRNGAYAGINGSYFCPTAYPSCAGKTNSFDTLLMNKDKVYFNSDNNVYSSVPAVIFGDSYVRFIGASSEWGRDTSISSMIANQPLMVQNGNRTFAGDGDPKKGSKAGRSFVANKDNTVYIGVVHSATVVETAYVLQTMGMQNALNLDSGGSTAFWSSGYKVGPGRNIPNAILFVSK